MFIHFPMHIPKLRINPFSQRLANSTIHDINSISLLYTGPISIQIDPGSYPLQQVTLGNPIRPIPLSLLPQAPIFGFSNSVSPRCGSYPGMHAEQPLQQRAVLYPLYLHFEYHQDEFLLAILVVTVASLQKFGAIPLNPEGNVAGTWRIDHAHRFRNVTCSSLPRTKVGVIGERVLKTDIL